MSAADSTDLHDRFVRLLTQHSRQIFAFILTLSPSRSDADDIFQDTSVALWRKFSTFEEGTNFRAWACQVAYLEVLDYRRKWGKQQSLHEKAFQALARDALLFTVEDSSYREDALAQCLKKLARSDRKLIERRYYAGQTARQIAEHGSQSVHSIYRNLSRIHDALMKCVQQSLAGETTP